MSTFAEALAAADLTQADLARLLQRREEQVSLWALSKVPTPTYALVVLDLMARLREVREAAGVQPWTTRLAAVMKAAGDPPPKHRRRGRPPQAK